MVERAQARLVAKPWGTDDLHPWSREGAGRRIGEIRYDLDDREAPAPALQLKLLFADAPLSLQVHPDDAAAHLAGRRRGKSEAWCVLRAAPGAHVALGLNRPQTSAQLSAAIDDGSIAQLADWRPVSEGDVLNLPAGTIHALGAGLVVAEIQQLCDDSYRMFDFAGARPLHRDAAVGAADRETAPDASPALRLSAARSVLVESAPFIFERLSFAPGARWRIAAARETWLLVTDGTAEIGLNPGEVGDAFHLNADRAVIEAGPLGATILCAYPGPTPDPALLFALSGSARGAAGAPSDHRAQAGPSGR
ncbi:class I mannose-6-phosphate isomerase [Albimonas sp. CAU 1670]|uniref:class I mannose-6-phosphate isomerase n=1 Tax=Albimonas sp. CAU 1670 TaxID=3032599 RepID=UPI0023DC1E78|nr:class I mannose-6-phosphate isomerase [Albimonas sp. CAU 1670]MDF2235306.1 class I mannose-6-phosphate isomerase [Albimonas sp. CAU 1670]